MKSYDVFRAGSIKCGTVYASCITKACKSYMETLDRPVKCELRNRESASIRYLDNYTICSDYIIMEA